MGMYAKVRSLYFRERLSINEIKRQTSLSRNTIKKWIRQGEGVEPKYIRVKAAGKITPYEPQLQLALQAGAHRPKRDRRTALVLFQENIFSYLCRYLCLKGGGLGWGWVSKAGLFALKPIPIPTVPRIALQSNAIRQAQSMLCETPASSP